MRNQFTILGWIFLIFSVRAIYAQDGPTLTRATLAARVAEIERANDLSGYRDAQSWSEDQSRLREQLVEMLGLPPLEKRGSDLQSAITGTLGFEDIVVEKLYFQSLPGLYVTANLYRPKSVEGRVPAVLYVCGHGRVNQNGVSLGNKTHYQHHPAWFARHGYVCMAIDTIQLGEIEGIHHGLYSFNRWDWPARGYTPAGVEAWNALRAIDYLVARPEVDASRIGITGRSGGGAYSWFAAAIDPRISVAVPVAGVTDLRDHVIGQCVRGHCDCMFMVNRYGWDYSMLAAMVFPRPLLIGNTDKDPIFPLDGVQRVHHQVRHVYHHGYKEQLGIQWTTGGHDDTQELQLGCFVWFDHFLRGKRRVITKPAEPLFERAQLRVFDSLPNDERVTDVQDWFVPQAPQRYPKDASEWDAMCRDWTDEISGTVHGRFPLSNLEQIRPHVPPTRKLASESSVLDRIIACYDVDVPPASLVRMVHFKMKTNSEPKRIIIIPADETKWELLNSLLHEPRQTLTADEETKWRSSLEVADEETEVVWVFPEGLGPWSWNGRLDKKEILHWKRSYLLCGWSLEGRQIAGLLRSLEIVKEQFPNTAIEMVADSDSSMIALHAALLSPVSLSGLHLGELPASYRDGFVLTGILRKCDLPAIVAATATRHPTSLASQRELDLTYVRSIETILLKKLVTLRSESHPSE
jgi:dienelactone hydrolase